MMDCVPQRSQFVVLVEVGTSMVHSKGFCQRVEFFELLLTVIGGILVHGMPEALDRLLDTAPFFNKLCFPADFFDLFRLEVVLKFELFDLCERLVDVPNSLAEAFDIRVILFFYNIVLVVPFVGLLILWLLWHIK